MNNVQKIFIFSEILKKFIVKIGNVPVMKKKWILENWLSEE